ncbi:MAG: zonular occludens toxin domain-containing protein [FCB group bacterium]|jgi:zona occludens toxin|nr:zonular occludens toxin domain-containing protein [FCB group bacterium]
MLTLITGTPGMGKTALGVDMLRELSKERPIFADGIKDLKIDHQPVPHIDEWVRCSTTATGAEEYEWTAFPPGSLIVIDECQRFFRPRHVSKAPPAAVAGFETHRHAGLDFILLTQSPSFLDSHIRKLTDKHIHIQDSFLGRFSYTWVGGGARDLTKADLKEASRKRYTPPKAAFPLYKSAELHTKKKREVPILVYVGGLSAVAFVFLAYRLVDSVSSRDEVGREPQLESRDASMPSGFGSSSGRPKLSHSAEWRIVGTIELPRYRVILSDGQRQRIIEPDTIKGSGSSLEVEKDGKVYTSWSRLLAM